MGYEQLPVDLPENELNHRVIGHVNLHTMYEHLRAIPDGQSPVMDGGLWVPAGPFVPIDVAATGNAASDTALIQEAMNDVGHRILRRHKIRLEGEFVIDQTLLAFERTLALTGNQKASITWVGPSGDDIIRFENCPHSGVEHLYIHGAKDDNKPRAAVNFEEIAGWAGTNLNYVRDVVISPPVGQTENMDRWFEYGVWMSGINTNGDHMDIRHFRITHADIGIYPSNSQNLYWSIDHGVLRRNGIGIQIAPKHTNLGTMAFLNNAVDVKILPSGGAHCRHHYSELGGKVLESEAGVYLVDNGTHIVNAGSHSPGDVVVDHLGDYGLYRFKNFRFWRLDDTDAGRMKLRFTNDTTRPVVATFENCWNIDESQVIVAGTGAAPYLDFDWTGQNVTGNTGRWITARPPTRNFDLQFTEDDVGPVLVDRTTGLPRRLVVDDGVVSTEAL